jgi:phosphate transport system substrate-binding protein
MSGFPWALWTPLARIVAGIGIIGVLGLGSLRAVQGQPLNATSGSGALTGAGSTFINPLMSKWSKVYKQMHPEVAINYQSIASGRGIQQFLARTVDFGATDAPLNSEQFDRAGGPAKALHIPAAMGPEAIVYNLTGWQVPLRLTPDLLANIYLGTVTKWNDPSLAAANPGVALPNIPIAVVHRSDASGTTDIFTDYLSKVSPEWKTKVGRGTSVKWPVGIGGQGSEGVTNQVSLTTGGIGYVELAYAKVNKLTYAVLRNRSGRFVEPSPDGTSAAAALLAGSLPDDLRYSITDAPGLNAYSIAGTTWFLVYVDQSDPAKGRALASFMWWTTHQGQSLAEDLFYAPLPPPLVKRVEEQIKKMRCENAACFNGT